ncbi:peptidoglycan-binding domain-containing protein [Paracoccus sp. NSM]|uniref:peptidoglycan-binding domain-containing protein n=1 Tax=Paracoccus sp. NSM TaxID=3457784 RepID=UPI0040373234
MRHLGVIVLAGMLPMQAMAEGAVIRLEAKRSQAAAAEAAAGWAERFDNVVTLPLPGGWTGIALGPLDRAEAEALLADLRAAREVPGDAFVSQPPASTVLQPVGVAPVGEPASAIVSETAVEPAPEAVAEAEPIAEPEAVAEAEPEPEPEAAPEPVLPEGRFIRLEAFETEAEAREALARWQAEFGDAWLWDLPDGWFALALGPLSPEVAEAWAPVLKTAEMIPSDAVVTGADSLGAPLVEAGAPDLPAPGAPEPLPPLEDVQRALRWAGHYTGAIDGKDGPMTQAAIRAEIATARRATDPGTAMRLLTEARAEWRDRMGLAELRDEATGLSVTAPLSALVFDRAERALSIYGPANDSGAALILFSQKGGQQELLDLAGLVTALGWVPSPERVIRQGHVHLRGENEAHRGEAEGRVRDGRAEGWVLIWPASDPETQTRIAAELSDSLDRFAPAAGEDAPAAPVTP